MRIQCWRRALRVCHGRGGQGQSGRQIRIGIHLGPVVAGVVAGKFTFDIFGDT